MIKLPNLDLDEDNKYWLKRSTDEMQKQEGGGVGTIASGGFSPTMGGGGGQPIDFYERQRIRKRIDDLLEKSKEYLATGEQPPKGVPTLVSRLGKRYYETSAHYTDTSKRVRRRIAPLVTPSGAKVPPNWKEVWVTTHKNSPLQAKGIDGVGRHVYLHSVTFDNGQRAKKWKRFAAFAKIFKGLEARVTKDAAKSEEALVLYTLMKTGFRVGSEEEHYAKKKAYGTCILEKKHVKVNGDKITFHFPAKKGTVVNKIITDPFLAKVFSKRLDEIDTTRLFKTTSSYVRKYLHSIPNGARFKNHDIRTYYGTEAALRKISRMPVPKSIAAFKKERRAVSEYVAKELGNTPAVALKSYICPEAWDKWMQEDWEGKIDKSDSMMEEFIDSTYYPDIDTFVESDSPEDDEEDDDGEEYDDSDLDYLYEEI